LHQSTSPAAGQPTAPAEALDVVSLETDLRWETAQRIAAGPQFSRSPLMSKFLLYVVAETLEGRQSGITEHQIGVHVFGRPQNYRTDEDNIVRNYARQLRRRLADHFANESNRDSMRLDIPVGGYVPVFTSTEPVLQAEASFGSLFSEPQVEHLQSMPGHETKEDPLHSPTSNPSPVSARVHAKTLRNFALAIVYSVALVCLTWLIASRVPAAAPNVEPSHMLWKTLLSDSNDTYIVPPDAGLNILEDISHRSLPLADYIKGSYLDLPLSSLDDHTRQDLRTQQFSNFQSLQIVAALARQREYDPQRVFLRFPRDLRLDDLKTANVILIGSASSNPWASIADSNTNFRIVLKEGMAGANIINSQPMTGEAASYASHWNEPSHETFALIAFVPNLSGNGHMLLLEGLDVAGTQAAAEVLFHSENIASILNRARLPDGNLRPFEILLRTTSIQSNSAGTQVVASRIHQG
jgi:hypothetical protein